MADVVYSFAGAADGIARSLPRDPVRWKQKFLLRLIRTTGLRIAQESIGATSAFLRYFFQIIVLKAFTGPNAEGLDRDSGKC
jgi:hypothetical protein